MVETHEYKGLWWLPSDETEKLSGTLTVTKGKAALELIGHFGQEPLSETETEKTHSLSLKEQPRIVVLTTSGKPVTLEGHQAASHTETFPGIPTASYRRNVALLGKQFADGEDIGFDEISIRASDLNEWTQVSGFNTKVGIEKHKEKDSTSSRKSRSTSKHQTTSRSRSPEASERSSRSTREARGWARAQTTSR